MVFVIVIGSVIFLQSECCVRGRTHCIRKTKYFLQAQSHFSRQASPQSHIGRRLASRSFTFVIAVEYEILLAD